jgi:outer membrane protein assembly factor BamB
MLYAVAYQGGVTAAHANTGRVMWSWSPAEAKICACVPAASEGRVFAGDDHGFVHCLDGDIGFPYWRYPTGAPVEECVTLPGNRMLITTYQSDTLCLSSGESPELLWTHPDSSTFVVQGKGKVYLLTRDNELCAVSIEDGKELWRRSLPEDMQAVGGSQKGHFYLYSDEGSVLALSEYK